MDDRERQKTKRSSHQIMDSLTVAADMNCLSTSNFQCLPGKKAHTEAGRVIKQLCLEP